MNIIQDFLTVNPYSRAGYVREVTQAIIIHWVANPMTSAKMNRDYFESLKNQKPKPGETIKYASTQYLVGLKGEVIQAMPDNEIAWSVGSGGKVDPESGKFYTDIARELFDKKYVTEIDKYSPSYASISIETCHKDWQGNYFEETLQSTAELVAFLFKKYGLIDVDRRLITHKQTVGWKDCPRLFSDHPEELVKFKERVKSLM